MSWKSLLVIAGSAAQQAMKAESSAAGKEIQAELAEQTAEHREEAASREWSRLRSEARDDRRRQRARYAARGVTPEGSPAKVLEEEAADSELELFDHKQKAYEAAERDRARAGFYRVLKDSDRAGGWLKVGRTLLSGASKFKYGSKS